MVQVSRKCESVLVLTACVDPQGMSYMALRDKETRFSQYKVALEWYLSNTQLRIVFGENSGFDITPYFESYIREGRLEVLTFRGNDYNRNFGKGYGEAATLDYILKHSAFIKEDTIVIKVTGRVICKNVNTLVWSYRAKDTVYTFHFKDQKGRMESNSQVVICPELFYEKYFLPRREDLDDSREYWYEHLLYDVIQAWSSDGHHYKEMWIPPIVEGTSGTTGDALKSYGFKYIVAYYIKYLLHRFHYYGSINIFKNLKGQ